MYKKILSTRDLCLTGVFTAIIAVLAQISIPMPYGVPMTLQTFAIPFAGIVLGAKRGTLSTLIYILLGAVGVPVFAGFSGGLGSVFGATGGFILSFPIVALMAGIGVDRKSKAMLVSGLATGAAINFFCGMLMYSFVLSCDLRTAFAACVLPFIPTAIAKAALAGAAGLKVRRVLVRNAIMA